MNNSKSLCHYGIKGMRWGVRRTPKQLGHPDSSSSFDKRKVKDLSDSELNRRINRLLKEQQYKGLTQSKASRIGKRIVQGIIVAAASETAKNFIGSYFKRGFNYIGSEISRQLYVDPDILSYKD